MKIATHNGPFHCDDVFAMAVLLKLYPEAEVVRSRNGEVIDACDMAQDVGDIYDHDKKRYDHHQKGHAGARPNGIFYSAIGLVWRHYGLEWCEGNQQLWDKMDTGLVMPMDADDNGQDLYELSRFDVDPIGLWDVVKWYRPFFGEDFTFDEGFMNAVAMATALLERYKARCLGGFAALEKVAGLYAEQPDKRLFVMAEHMPLGEFAEQAPELLYTVYPDINNNWRVSTVNKEKGSFAARKDLPSTWAGVRDKELQVLTGVDTALFCHNALFICGATTKDGALALAKLALAA